MEERLPAAFLDRHAVLAAGYGGRADPEDPAQVLAMPMVLHITKVHPPARSALLAAAAAATVALCLDERAGTTDDGEPGPWRQALLDWTGSRIRKVARRARGSQWLAAQHVDGVTVEVDGAQARAIVPGPVGEVDQRVRKLQIGGTDLEHDEPGEPAAGLPVLWVNRSLEMTVGKAAAQVGHASMLLAGAMDPERAWAWSRDGYRCSVRDADPARWAALGELVAQGRAIAVRDAGYTEVAPGSMTVIAPVG
ncbi:aminoacyl-tRNA hydrolase [Rhodococcus sp. UNC363MFTsu5.1]|uniref:aminoacyl-tRNA hydrolase n=1 Tax=Rhodococcus sp. UNC363MFTsu5.1 TaxID=1449069 RepID=UPI000485EC79|nr:aminoacyl-tRNA hydrolase [Rhodococcus sp. UNC363MFTsu5.1]